jgi:hypothetical protein
VSCPLARVWLRRSGRIQVSAEGHAPVQQTARGGASAAVLDGGAGIDRGCGGRRSCRVARGARSPTRSGGRRAGAASAHEAGSNRPRNVMKDTLPLCLRRRAVRWPAVGVGTACRGRVQRRVRRRTLHGGASAAQDGNVTVTAVAPPSPAISGGALLRSRAADDVGWSNTVGVPTERAARCRRYQLGSR